ncbi:MAG: Pyridoxal-5-phosphate-dependent protein beta subunit [Streptosporangiaceae bacterium]|nr:Pyridoxal-5-phosphate-dependent protein beta subunit [Streptosporangiaceae bacterium]
MRTPLVPLPFSDPPLFIKPESLQPTGAFKLRGAYAAITALPEAERKRGVVTHSSGNHGQAVAYAAHALDIQAVLVLPNNAPATKVDACRALGAEIVFVEPTLSARKNTTAQLAEAHGFHIVPPFDDARVIAGQGTIGLEILEDAPDIDVVLVPVGGGGLISGVAAAVKSLSPKTKVIGVEPELAADARDSLRAGRAISWPAEDTARTFADALRVQQVGDLPLAHMLEYVDDIVVVSEEEIREAMRLLARAARLVAEPAGAVATAAYLYRRGELSGDRSYAAVLSGGNVDPDVLRTVVA